MNMRLRLSRSDLLTVAGVAYRPVEVQADAITLERSDQPGITQSFSHAEIHELLRSSDTRYQAGYFDFARSRDRQNRPVDLLAELEDEARSIVLWRQAICDSVLKLEQDGRVARTYASVTAILPALDYEVRRKSGQIGTDAGGRRAGAKLVTRKLPCAKTILRWLRAYENGGYDPLALLPRTHRSGNRGLRWCHRTEAMVSEVIEIYASTQRPTKRQAVADTRNRIKSENLRRRADGQTELALPSGRSLLRRLSQANPYYIHARRWGIDAANRKFNLFETGVETLFPGERVEMDENRLDVISLLTVSGVLDHLPPEQVERLKGRRWLYVAKDAATKCILALRLANTPNAQDAIRALRDVFHDRTLYAQAASCESPRDQVAGIGTLVTDQGSAFISEEFRAVAASLGLTMHFPPAGLPQMRGNIESFFRTLGHKLMPLLSGRTFFNPVQRADYPSEQLACLDDDDLIRILLTLVVDIYHNEPHGSPKDETPAHCWKRLASEQGLLPVPDGLVLRKAFGRPMMRRLRGDGVLFAGLSYSCDALREALLHSPERDVEVRADLFDLDWIAVKVGSIWHAATCNHRGFDGMRYSDWQEASRALRLKHRRAAALSEDLVQRAVARISEANRAAVLRMQLTPFHVTDADVARNEKALHFSLTSSTEKLTGQSSGADPLAEGIEILPLSQSAPIPGPACTNGLSKDKPPSSAATWSFDDE
ncbi:Integrase core domain-containing protein [Paracoccus halophilus]|uniref:Integrase core domain-containing protein n=1 Tax=Paracoccus halophilus TaxID=376733 RepID=A0A1I0U5S1_9RHOB|nr:DDE-type integrase/transposase/recombinase [Paracoccus halophilus]SFA59243.1 Integrase core domain-containing protein [Paracoccus halophilus]